MSIRLIVNADDYARTSEVSRGIRDAHHRGIITSTSAMMNMANAARDAAIAARETPNLGIGVHLTLTSGLPILPPEELSSIVIGNAFPNFKQFSEQIKAIDPREAQNEWRAQISALIVATGRKPTHLDSHHHASYLSAGLFRAMLELACEYNCAIRLPSDQGIDASAAALPEEILMPIKQYSLPLIEQFNPRAPDRFIASFYDQSATKDQLLGILSSLQDGATEIMCHPGYADADLIATSGYSHERENELDIMIDPEIQTAIERHNIQLIHFGHLS